MPGEAVLLRVRQREIGVGLAADVERPPAFEGIERWLGQGWAPLSNALQRTAASEPTAVPARRRLESDRRGGAPVAPDCSGYSGFRKPTPDFWSHSKLARATSRHAARQRFAPLAVEARDLACERGGRIVFSGLSFRAGAGQLLAGHGPERLREIEPAPPPRRPSPTRTPEASRIEGASEDEAVAHYLGHADALKPALTLRETLALLAARSIGSRGACRSTPISTNAAEMRRSSPCARSSGRRPLRRPAAARRPCAPPPLAASALAAR